MKPDKIGTITTHKADNYGAVLQAYALCSYINKYVPCEIINYCPEYVKASYSLQRKLRSPKDLLYFIYDRIHLNERKRRKERFADFRSRYMKMSPEYSTAEELNKASADYRAIIAGSDQIWNPGIHNFDENYFLTFCADGVKKFGYAPSFGVSQLDPKQRKIITLRCEGFSDIAFREKSGVALARELFGRDFPLVLDPVFLLGRDEWLNLLPDVAPKEPYYLCYYLSDPRESVKHSCRLGKKNDCKVYSIGYSIMNIKDTAQKVYDLGPLEFLAYLYHAECVFTDSFHATAFSLIFNKPFYTRIDGKNAKRSDRVVTLLESLQLSERMYNEKDLDTIEMIKPNYEIINTLSNEWVKQSKGFIDVIVRTC